jgi:hypothetical protein
VGTDMLTSYTHNNIISNSPPLHIVQQPTRPSDLVVVTPCTILRASL